MKILSFDTCLDKMYVALGEDDKILGSKIVETTKSHYHSAFLISTIANILKENGLAPQDLDVIATNIGPGSFTGIRACTTVARVMAQACETKTVGVSSLEILSKINPSDKPTLVALDARKNMVYVSIFKNGEQIFSPQSILLEDLKEMIEKEEYFIVTDNMLKSVIGGISYQECQDDLGAFLVQIAKNKIEQGCESDWRKLHPLYIQPAAVNIKKA